MIHLLAALVAAFLVGGLATVMTLAANPHFAGLDSVFRQPPAPRHLFGIAAIIGAVGVWGAFAFWAGTGYAGASTCVSAARLGHSLGQTTAAVQALASSVTEFSDDVDRLRQGIVRTRPSPPPAPSPSRPVSTGGPR